MISQCLNPDCLHVNLENTELCERCNSQLLLMNRYRAISLLGKGGFGRTFLAIDELKPSRPRCVIKQFLPEIKSAKAIQKAAELFEQEAVCLEQLGQHQQIPTLLAFFNQEERKYLIQEYVDGNNLLTVLSEEGVFNQQQIKELLNDLLDVLDFVHHSNVIHRDIKPENIIKRRQDGKLVLVDFGAAKEALSVDASQVGTIIGSVSYIAPEQAAGKAKFASDLYSLGATCLHLLTNIEPIKLFNTEEGEWDWRSHLKDNDIDYELSHVLDKLVEGATKRRFQSVEEVFKALSAEKTLIPAVSTASNQRSHHQTTAKSSIQSPPLQQKVPKLDLQVLEFQYAKISHDPCLMLGRKISLATSRYSAKAKYITLELADQITLNLIGIPGGTFIMGSQESELEREAEESPPHSVTIRPFLLSQFPITQAQWWTVMKQNPSRFVAGDVTQSKKPVERVSWLDCDLFCKNLSQLVGREIRLPSEAEWEYACRGKTQTPFHCGSTLNTELANYNGEEIYGTGLVGENRQQTTDVDCFSANPFGLYDLHGNVAEWCADTWHSNYDDAPTDENPWISSNPKDLRVLRGGSWLHLPGSCRSAQRFKSAPHNKSDAFGLRIAASI